MINRRTAAAEISARMRAVRRMNTDAEQSLQRALRKRGFSFTTHQRVVDCKPDLVFRKSKVVVFVDGDFWHGRTLIEQGYESLSDAFTASKREFWVSKIQRNVARDQKQVRSLRRHGWSVIRLWERDIANMIDYCADLVESRVRARLNSSARGNQTHRDIRL